MSTLSSNEYGIEVCTSLNIDYYELGKRLARLGCDEQSEFLEGLAEGLHNLGKVEGLYQIGYIAGTSNGRSAWLAEELHCAFGALVEV